MRRTLSRGNSIAGLALTVAVLSSGCGGGGGGGAAPPAPATAAGSWSGSWVSANGVGGDALYLSIKQSGANLSGPIFFDRSPCLSAGTFSAILSGNSFNGVVTAASTHANVTLDAIVANGQLNGTYNVTAADWCTGEHGSFSLSSGARFVPPPNPLYVRSSGNDGNSGANPADALRSISTAVQLARTGYVIVVGSGTYSESVVVDTAGVAGLQLVADLAGDRTGDAAGDVAIDGTDSDAGAGFDFSTVPGGLIDGFTISGVSGAGIIIDSGSDAFAVQNCMIFDNTADGIRVQDSANALVFNNLVYGNGGAGIAIAGQRSGSPAARVLSNTIAGNGTYGLVVGDTNAGSPRAFVHNNIVQGNSGEANINVLQSPRSDVGYDGNYNLVFPDTYLPASLRGRNDVSDNAQFADGFHLRSTSPAIDGGGPLNLPSSQTTILRRRTTTGTTLDSGVFDLGFHFLRNR